MKSLFLLQEYLAFISFETITQTWSDGNLPREMTKKGADLFRGLPEKFKTISGSRCRWPAHCYTRSQGTGAAMCWISRKSDPSLWLLRNRWEPFSSPWRRRCRPEPYRWRLRIFPAVCCFRWTAECWTGRCPRFLRWYVQGWWHSQRLCFFIVQCRCNLKGRAGCEWQCDNCGYRGNHDFSQHNKTPFVIFWLTRINYILIGKHARDFL